MKPDLIHHKARVWTVTIGADGKLRADLDPDRVAALPDQPAAPATASARLAA